MSKKLQILVILFILSFSLFACQDDITIDIVDESVTMTEGDTYQIDFTTNDTNGIAFSSSDLTVLTIDENGLVTALKEGTAEVTLTSTKDESVHFTIPVTVLKLFIITTDTLTYQITVGDEVTADYSANDDVTFLSSDTTIFTVDEDGNISGLKEGQAQLTITSVYNDQVSITVEINVSKIITIDVDQLTEALWVDSEIQIDYESNDDVEFISSNTGIASVSPTGLITGVAQGSTTITIQSVTNNSINKVITVDVYLPTEMIMIDGNDLVNLESENQLLISAGPDMAYPFVLWESSDVEIASIDQNGLLTANSVGLVTITAISLYDENLTDTFDIQVVNYMLVDLLAEQGDTIDFMELSFTFNQDLYDSIQDAIDASTPGATIYVQEGTFTENITINQNGLRLIGSDSTILQGELDVQADDVLVENFEFALLARVTNTVQISNFEFNLNTVENSTLTAAPLIYLIGVTGVKISMNTFANLSTDAIFIRNFLGGEIIIEKNTISNVMDAITILAETEYDDLTMIQVVRNDIDGAQVALNIDLVYGGDQKPIYAYARFNSIANYSSYAVESNIGNQIDFTCNYWGIAEPDPLKFLNVSPSFYRGYYTEKADIVSELAYNPALPVTFEITNPIYEIIIGDSHTFTFDALPLDIVSPKYKWITSDPTVLMINTTGTITPLKSGIATLTLRSSIDIRINTTITITVSTTPGIELTTSNVDNDIIVGDTVTLTATPFPFNIKDDLVSFISSDPSIATIDEDGLVTTLTTGDVTFTAALIDDPSVQTSYTISIYSALDENNLLDLLTTYQLSFSTEHRWLQYGTSFNYTEIRYDSVSRYLFQNIDINTSKLLPISTGIRPGILKPEHPEGITTYNPEHVYWVVVHETANTSPGAGALSHANYLWNAAQAGNELWVSWHYTMDARVTYQHVPENEIAYHAGDGSSLPGTSLTYLGGGNRNGIGIEMSVAQDEDMFMTFQRTAKLASDILVRYNLPRSHIKFHQDFSGKWCPQGMLRGGMVPIFQELADAEYAIRLVQEERTILFETNNPEYLDNTGRIINMPDRPMTVSYTVTITESGVSTSRTFFTYLPGTVH